ncbi:hypothetical protein J4421_04600 [Candidatus Woesearchaeota archaeon]|nr:hypothetical protein [Candidatus Woesearchaeota archaeon]
MALEKKKVARGLQFGMEQNGIKYISNVPVERLEQLLEDIEDLAFPPVVSDKVVVLEMNNYYTFFLLEQLCALVPEMGDRPKLLEHQLPRYPHHVGNNLSKGYGVNDDVPSPVMNIKGRMKDVGSCLEKIARKTAQLHSVQSTYLQGHVNIHDVYGFKCVVVDKESEKEMERRLYHHPSFDKVSIDQARHEKYKKEMLLEAHQSEGYRILALVLSREAKEAKTIKFIQNEFVREALLVRF